MSAVLVVTGARENPEPYVGALAGAGVAGERIRIIAPAPGAVAEAGRLVAEADGIVLCGGGDVHPRHYGEGALPAVRLALEEDRDELELAVLVAARETRTPVFGVCRGLQVINVFFGGTLWQDLAYQRAGSLLHRQEHPYDALIHPVRVTATTTRLGELLAWEPPLVNSRHHQGIKNLARGLITVGQAPDGLVEAISADDGWWLHAVQWHPENLVAMAQSRALWSSFAAATRAGAGPHAA